MTYIVMDPCIKCKFMDCVEVCPVDCFYEGENFLAINPDECIDCGVCEPECPVDAIKPGHRGRSGRQVAADQLRTTRKVWPNITVKGEPPADAEAFEREDRQVREVLLREARPRVLTCLGAPLTGSAQPFHSAGFCVNVLATTTKAFARVGL